jgi:hypothetical protein
MQLLKRSVVFSLLLIPLLTFGQAGNGNYSIISLKDLSSFENPGKNWVVRGSVSAHPKVPAKVKVTPGEGILVGTAGNAISTKVKASDLRLYAEFMVSAGADGNLVLPGGQKVRISDSYSQNVISASTSGFAGQFPAQNAAKAPGLWQTIELAYDASTSQGSHSARLNTLKINGVMVLEAIYFPQSKTVSDPQAIAFEVNKGTIAFRNIGYQLLGTGKPVSLANLEYKVYADKWDAKEYNKLDREGKSDILTQEVTNGLREFHLVYEGDIIARETGDYIFTSIYSGPAFSLDIDSKPIMATGESTSQETHGASVYLTEGKHKMKIHYSRFPWRSSALGLRVEKPGVRPYDLHALSSLPEPEPKPFIAVEPTTQVEMVRSFVLLPNENNKRTHCISVGSPTGWNYTMDLNRGALLQAWRGRFADVSEMWYERGEPQLLFPEGLRVPISGKSSFAALANEQATWPDSSNIDYRGYDIVAGGYPSFKYAAGQALIHERLVAGKNGIVRSFHTEGNVNGGLYAMLAGGSRINEIEKGLYQVDDRYYVQTDPKSKTLIRKSGENQELVLLIAQGSSYTIFW